MCPIWFQCWRIFVWHSIRGIFVGIRGSNHSKGLVAHCLTSSTWVTPNVIWNWGTQWPGSWILLPLLPSRYDFSSTLPCICGGLEHVQLPNGLQSLVFGEEFEPWTFSVWQVLVRVRSITVDETDRIISHCFKWCRSGSRKISLGSSCRENRVLME